MISMDIVWWMEEGIQYILLDINDCYHMQQLISID